MDLSTKPVSVVPPTARAEQVEAFSIQLLGKPGKAKLGISPQYSAFRCDLNGQQVKISLGEAAKGVYQPSVGGLVKSGPSGSAQLTPEEGFTLFANLCLSDDPVARQFRTPESLSELSHASAELFARLRTLAVEHLLRSIPPDPAVWSGRTEGSFNGDLAFLDVPVQFGDIEIGVTLSYFVNQDEKPSLWMRIDAGSVKRLAYLNTQTLAEPLRAFVTGLRASLPHDEAEQTPDTRAMTLWSHVVENLPERPSFEKALEEAGASRFESDFTP